MVWFKPSVIVKTMCGMDVTWFPFDTQKCRFFYQIFEGTVENKVDIWGVIGDYWSHYVKQYFIIIFSKFHSH
jgi:hypothetical protein